VALDAMPVAYGASVGFHGRHAGFRARRVPDGWKAAETAACLQQGASAAGCLSGKNGYSATVAARLDGQHQGVRQPSLGTVLAERKAASAASWDQF